MADKLIITAALTGAITIPTQTPHLPFTPEHLIADAIACGPSSKPMMWGTCTICGS